MCSQEGLPDLRSEEPVLSYLSRRQDSALLPPAALEHLSDGDGLRCSSGGPSISCLKTKGNTPSKTRRDGASGDLRRSGVGTGALPDPRGEPGPWQRKAARLSQSPAAALPPGRAISPAVPASPPAGRTISGWPDEQSMGELELNYSTDAVRVIFNNTFSYHLKFLWGHRIPTMKEHRDHSGNLPIGKKKIYFLLFCH